VGDSFVVFHGKGGKGCVAPMTDELPARLQELPGFDNAKVIEAANCAENARFVCWTKT